MKKKVESLLARFGIPFTLLLGYMTLSAADRTYLIGVSNVPIVGVLIFIFITYYATPGYIFLFILQAISGLLKYKKLQKAINSSFAISSIPLNMVTFGFNSFYKEIMKKENPDGGKKVLASLVSIALIAALQARVFPETLLAIVSLSIVFYMAGWISGLAGKPAPEKSD